MISTSAPSTAPQGGDAVVVFDAGAQTFALSVALVREVVPLERVVDVPRAPRGVVGLFPLRGAPLCAVDAATLIDPAQPGRRRRLALVAVRRRAVVCALAVDLVHGVAELSPASVVPRDPHRDPAIVDGFCTVDRRGVTVLAPAELVRRIESLRLH